MKEELDEAVQAYNEIENRLQAFYQQNPELYEYLRDLLTERANRLNRVESLARKLDVSAGPVRRKGTMDVVVQPALEEWVAKVGPERATAAGVVMAPKATSAAIRHAEKVGLISPSDAANLLSRRSTFTVPPAETIPEKKEP